LLYGACIALVQRDLKRLVGYSILSHLSFCTLGIFCFALSGLNGAVYQILNHGLSGSAMLILVGFLYERYGTYEMAQFGGLAAKLPNMATLYVITTLSLIGLPIMNGFVGEFLILSGSFASHPGWVFAATFGVILGAAYMLGMIRQIFYGPQSSLVTARSIPDLNGREHLTLWPMAALMLVMGVISPYWMHAINDGVTGLADTATARIATPSSHITASAAQVTSQTNAAAATVALAEKQ
jgi:NADH-quinone oxidoreductase subunit M